MAGVIALLKEDHRKLVAVFEKLEQATPRQARALLRQTAELLIPHAKAEEEVIDPQPEAAPEAAPVDESSEVDDGGAEEHHGGSPGPTITTG